MKILNRYLLKELTSPFLTTLFILVFVLVSQFILKNLDRFLGKDLSFIIIIKFILLNAAWIVSLAVPMAVLVTTLMTFGKLSYNNEITAFKASGIKYIDLLKPSLLFGATVLFLLIPYNLWILPEMNHDVRKLGFHISKKRPDIEFHENILNTLSDKRIYLGDRINSNTFSNIKIFDNGNRYNHTTIMAENGNFISKSDGVILDLYNGSIHENPINNSEYRKTYFENYKIAIPFDELGYDKNQIIKKQEREMNISLLNGKVNYFSDKINKTESKLESNSILLDSLNQVLLQYKKNNKISLLSINKLKNRINILDKKQIKNQKLIPLYNREKNKYNVEIHKKFSVPFACIIFVLLGMPLGIMSKGGNMGVSVSISLGIFIVYWCFLILGEDLADKTIINPGIAMWAPNILLCFISYYLYKLINRENYRINFNILAILKNKYSYDKSNH